VAVGVVDLDLECLATWKDGSESYLYSRLTSTSSAAAADIDGDQYRCLVSEYDLFTAREHILRQ